MSKNRQALLSDRVPLEDHIADDVVLMRDDGVLAAFEVGGVFPDTADATDIASWFDRLHGALSNLAAEDLELIFYQCRGEADPSIYLPGLHRSEFAQRLDVAYRDNLVRGSLYSNRLFMTVQVQAPNVATKSLSWLLGDAVSDPSAGIHERMTRLNEICDLLQTQLSVFGLRRLGYVTRNRLVFSEIAEAIVFALTGKWRPVGATTGRMGNAMFSEAIRFRRQRIEFHGAGEVEYGEMFAFREPPATCWPGMFHSLAMAPYRNTIVQSYRFLSNAAAMNAATRKQHKMQIAGDKALSQMAELTGAADDIQSRRWVLGDHSFVLIAFASNARAMSEVSNAAWRDLASCGLVATRLTHALQGGFLSMLPGGAFWRPRPGFISSRNLCAFTPLYNWPAGQRQGYWPGPPIATFRTMAGTPFHFHWHPPGSDVGNTLVTGATGAGKTLLTGTLLAMTAGRARIIALDHKRGWDLLIHEMSGDYAVLGEGRPNFAPLKALDASPRNLEFLTDLFRGCIGGPMTEDEGRRLSVGLATVMTLPAADRSVGELRAFFDDEPEGAGARLDRWCAGNELGWVVDAPVDRVAFRALSGLDVTALLENERARGVAMSYLMHRIAGSLDGSPCLILVDEGWRALIDPSFRKLIETQLRTIRSKNGAVVFITQSPGDIVQSGISRVLKEMCQTHLALPNPRGLKSDYVHGMGLTEGQWDALRILQGGQGMFLLIQGTNSAVVQLLMGQGMERFISVLSARAIDLQRMDRIRAEAADADPSEAFHQEKEEEAA